MTTTYGTAEFYKDQFADLLADVDGASPNYGDALVEGFLLAIADWRDYHKAQVNEYDRIEQRIRPTYRM
jgi:hypothetical protein